MTNTNTGSLVIADSSGLISLLHPGDVNHGKAARLVQQLDPAAGQVLIPSEVFAETINVVGRTLGHSVAVATGWELARSATFLVVETNEEIRQESLHKFEKLPDSVSLTDCLVMACADFYGTTAIFGFDKVFARNGYPLPSA